MGFGKKVLLAAFACCLVVQGGSAQAQTTIDVSKITCQQFLTFRVADPEKIAIWLSGYFHGLRKDSTIDVQVVQAAFERLKNECFSRPNATVMQVVEGLK